MTAELAQKIRASSVEVRSGRRGCGAGVVWAADGSIVTNAHVVRSAGAPLVKLTDGREFRADVTRHNTDRDLALLHIGAANLVPAELGDSSSVRVGQMVAAVGNPLGVIGALSTGVIHATGEDRWIQADVRLAPGNSGGILADILGRVIGINTMIYGGLALAIPSNTVEAFVRGEEFDKPLLGIEMAPVTVQAQPALAILDVVRGSLAEQAGLLVGDVILLSAEQLRAALHRRGTLTLPLLRGRQARQISVRLPQRGSVSQGAQAA